MFAKIFSQIYDGSLREVPETRFTFMDMLILANQDGVVDMTHEAIAARTNRPIEVIRATIAELEAIDQRSRTPEYSGIRIKRLDDHRDWGWWIVNYDKFRKIASDEQRRNKTRERVARFDLRRKNLQLTNASLTLTNATNAKQKQKQKQKKEEESTAGAVSSVGAEKDEERQKFIDLWNVHGARKIKFFPEKRRKALTLRLKESYFAENYRQALVKLKESDFLQGRNERNWVAGPDWFLRPDSVGKIIEGNYDNPPGKNSKSVQRSEEEEHFIDSWNREFARKHNGVKYSFGDRDENAVRELLKLDSETELIIVALGAWSHPGFFNCKQASTIFGFFNRINEIREEVKEADKP